MENTDQAIKIYETYTSRAIETNTTVLMTGVSNDDNPEVVTLKVQITKITVCSPSPRKMDTTTRSVISTNC